MQEKSRFTAEEILGDAGISGINPSKMGRQYTRCPNCSDYRTGFNKKAPCLAVNIDDRGVRWFCNHCEQFKGGRYFEAPATATGMGQRRDARQHPARHPNGRPTVSGYALMQAQARRSWVR